MFSRLPLGLQETPVVTTLNPVEVKKLLENWIFDGWR